MEPHLQHTHGRHYDDHDTFNANANANAGTGTHHSGHDYDEDEHHGEKKSVIKKVKEKAKKLKNTITKHGHGHGGDDHDHHHHDDDDDDDEEMEEDAEVHGAPMYDSPRVGLGGPDAILAQPRGNLERPSVMAEDRYDRSHVVEPHGAPPTVSTGPYGTNLSEPSGLGHPQAYGQEVNPNQWRGKIGQSTGMEEDPFAPMVSRTHQEESRGSIGKSTGMVKDPNAPKEPSMVGSDPSNYETKVTDPTHTGGKEAELSQIQHSFGKMGIHDEDDDSGPKRFDPNHPENLPRETLTGNPSSRSSTYVEKISSSASAIADKAADAIASKLGYSGQTPSSESDETVKKPGSATDYAHKITDKVSETLAPVYEKVVDAGSSVISKVQGSVSGQPQAEVQVEKGKEGDKVVSVKEYLVETLRPGDDDKALSEVITHAFHRGSHEESEKKCGEDRAEVGRVTESEEVRRRLGSDRDHDSSNVVAEKGVADRLKDAVGSWFGGKGDAPQGTVGTSYVTDEGLSTSPSPGENRNGGSGGGQ
ncbi:low-temperature-induced 65 kDa protein-like [Cynara cardunculus var. scolymus]|uniref:low-temperature-induced 65 kDa protein-like n=1 Tax=Cynara cardunculus var. scolymus TaxID=59895 RepID=UPI000D626CB2|nr:low-temperature-induced 65 kDa protein-like [Cynara cardunculus var. scolymus]